MRLIGMARRTLRNEWYGKKIVIRKATFSCSNTASLQPLVFEQFHIRNHAAAALSNLFACLSVAKLQQIPAFHRPLLRISSIVITQRILPYVKYRVFKGLAFPGMAIAQTLDRKTNMERSNLMKRPKQR